MGSQRLFRRRLVFWVWGLWVTLPLLMLMLLLWASAALTAPVHAQGQPTPTLRPVTLAEVNAASRNLYCPVCENLPLAVCYTAACEDWKTQVRDLLARGYTVEEIEAYFVARFGQKTVGTPTTPVAQWLTVGLPAALIGLIGVVIAVNLWQWRRQHQINQISSQVARSRDAGGADAHEVEGEYHRRLEEELRDREGNR